MESAFDAHDTTSLPYSLLITRILLHYSIDLFSFPVVEVSTTYDSKTFASTGYILVDTKWCKKESTKSKSDLPKISKSVTNLLSSLLKEMEELQKCLKTIEEGILSIQESTSRLL